MGNSIASDRRFNHMRERAVKHLLPDTCQIYKPDRVVTPSGSYEEIKGAPLEYNGSPDIPCRLDVSKHYRSEEVFGQEAVVNDYELHVPWDAPILADHTITYEGEDYEVRKLLDTNSFRVTKVALVSRVDLGKRS